MPVTSSADAVDGDRQPGRRAGAHPQAAPRDWNAPRRRGRRRGRSVARARRADAPRATPRPTQATISWRAAATGLVAEVAGVAADTGRRLAIVPTGAGNDFARELGYDTKHPLDAFDALGERPRPGRRPRPGQRPLVHVRHRVGLRRRSEPLGEHRAAALGHRAVRRRGAAHARGLQAAPVPAHRRRRSARVRGVARRGRQRTGVRRRACTSRPTRRSTTGCSTSPSSASCRSRQLLVDFPKVFKGTHVVAPRR